MTKQEFLATLANAKPGQRICYHVGLLMADRQVRSAQTDEQKAASKCLSEVANVAWELAGMVKDNVTLRWVCQRKPEVDLVQRRLSPSFGFEYYAVKR
jgi:hypothetical protein